MNVRMLAPFVALLTSLLMSGPATAGSVEKLVSIQQAQLAKQQEQIKKLIADSEAMKADISTCKANDGKQKWAEERFCILANGTCPNGFTRYSGYMRGISMFEDKVNAPFYLTPANFGSSSIGWHGGAPYRYGPYAGDLDLQTCCK